MEEVEDKPWPWVTQKLRRPARQGWYAVQDETMHADTRWYRDAYWENGSWWEFGRMANVMNVRRELTDIVRWRFMPAIGRADILKDAPKALIPKGRLRWNSPGVENKLIVKEQVNESTT